MLDKGKENKLHTENMAVGYDRHILIDKIDIALKPGEILTIIGPNGSGKSTVLRSLIGELKLIKGAVYFGGRDRDSIDPKELAKKLSVLMTDRVKSELMTCFDVAATARYPYTGSLGLLSDDDRKIVKEALETVNASDLAERDFNNISDGQRQRVMLARCIAQEPEIIVLDEPTSFLDIKYKLEFLRILRKLKEERNVSVIMSVHEIELARQISDRVICIGSKGIDRIGTKDEIFVPEYICGLFDISEEDYTRLYPDTVSGKYDKASEIQGETNGCTYMTDSLKSKILRDASGYVSRNGKLLRKGITTGTCAAAAAYAAAKLLLTGDLTDKVTVHTPSGETIDVPVYLYDREDLATDYNINTVNDSEVNTDGEEGESASCYVIKDSGDDPDVTNGARVVVSVTRSGEGGLTEISSNDSLSNVVLDWEDQIKNRDPYRAYAFIDEEYPGIFLTGGRGVGIVTKEGLEQPVGYPAINKVPRAMIFEAVDGARKECEDKSSLLVTVSVEDGEQMAVKTFNPELGIKGGISILGTGGILEPMSEKAIIDTIETAIKQQAVMGHRALLLTPGQYGQSYVKNELKLPTDTAVKCSNYIGDAIDFAGTYGCTHLLLVGNLGKLIKLAAGIMNTHSRTADGRMDIMCTHLALCGGSRDMVREIYECINTDTMLDKLNGWGLYYEVIASLLDAIHLRVTKRSAENLKVGVMLFSEKYGYLGETAYAKEALEAYMSEIKS